MVRTGILEDWSCCCVCAGGVLKELKTFWCVFTLMRLDSFVKAFFNAYRARWTKKKENRLFTVDSGTRGIKASCQKGYQIICEDKERRSAGRATSAKYLRNNVKQGPESTANTIVPVLYAASQSVLLQKGNTRSVILTIVRRGLWAKTWKTESLFHTWMTKTWALHDVISNRGWTKKIVAQIYLGFVNLALLSKHELSHSGGIRSFENCYETRKMYLTVWRHGMLHRDWHYSNWGINKVNGRLAIANKTAAGTYTGNKNLDRSFNIDPGRRFLWRRSNERGSPSYQIQHYL